MYKSVINYSLSLIFILTLFSCGAGDDTAGTDMSEKDENVVMVPVGANFVPMHDMNRPGKWEEVKYQHDMLINMKKQDKKEIYTLTVDVSMMVDNAHYIDAILVYDVNMNELKKADLGKQVTPTAIFTFTKAEILPIFVIVAKCSKHGMWIKRFYPGDFISLK